MTGSPPAAPPDLRGEQAPSYFWVPPSASSAGEEAVELAAIAGLHLDPWEAFVLSHALGEDPDGKWAAFEIGLMVSRQNGKGAILEARELAGLFLLDERLIIHSAHEFPTSLEAFRRLLALIEDTPDFDRRVKRVSRSHGEEGIELKGGQRIWFRTRTKGGGRGFTGDCLMLDEAMEIPTTAHGALLPTLSARPNPQVWYTGTAVDQWVHPHGVVFARIRERGLAGDDPSLAYFDWSLEAENPDEVDEKMATDPDSWAAANPGLGIRITPDYVAKEQRSMDPRTFAVERLGVGDWPSTDALGGQVIDEETWSALADAGSEPQEPICFAPDVSPDRSSSSIGVAGRRDDGKGHVEVVERRRGTGWVVDRLVELVEAHRPAAVLLDGGGPAAALIEPLEQRGLEVIVVNAREYTQACETFFDACDQDGLRHLEQAELTIAVRGAAQRPLGDAWAWSRKAAAVDITPLVACTLALWGVVTQEGESPWDRRAKAEEALL